MPIEIDVSDSTMDRARQLAATLRDLGDRELIPALRRELSASTKQGRMRIRDRIRQKLPKRGGLNRWVGKTPTVSSEIRPKWASVKIKLGQKDHDLVQLNQDGIARHPLFANRKRWFATRLPSGPKWWEASAEPERAELQARVQAAIDSTIQTAMDRYGGE